jgi:hypothetical protein
MGFGSRGKVPSSAFSAAFVSGRELVDAWIADAHAMCGAKHESALQNWERIYVTVCHDRRCAVCFGGGGIGS